MPPHVRRSALPYVSVLVALGSVVAIFAVVGMGNAQAQVRWPLEVQYRVESQAHPRLDSELMVQERAFSGAGWAEWSDVQVRNIRQSSESCYVQFPDGTLYEGVSEAGEPSVEQCTALSVATKADPTEGSAPNPWLSPRTRAQYIDLGFAEVESQRAVDVAASLDLPVDDLVELENAAARDCSDLGYEDCAANDTTQTQRQTIVLYEPLGLPLLNEELFGEVVLTRYEVLSFGATQSYTAPQRPTP